MDGIFEKTYFGNSFQHYLLVVFFVATGLWVAKFVIRILVNKVLSRGKNAWSAFAADRVGTDGLKLAWILIIYAGFHFLHFRADVEKFIHTLLTAAAFFYSIKLVSKSLWFVVENNPQHSGSNEKSRELRGIMLAVNLVLWSLGFVFFLYNQGYNVTAVLTGLGIGGLAIALASQTFLVDIFNYFVIFFDKPFEIGDFIAVDDKKGTVEYVGLKTTRLTSLSGEQIILTNGDIAKARVHNYKRMKNRTVVFTLKVAKNTSAEQLKLIPPLVGEIIKCQRDTRFDHAAFMAFGDYSFDFEVVYVIKSPDDTLFIEINQCVNLSIVEAFQKNNIRLAEPFQHSFDVHSSNSTESGSHRMMTSNSR